MKSQSKENQEKLNYYKNVYNIKLRNTSSETARILCCVENTLRKSRSTGELFGVPAPRHIKVGYSVFYRLEDLVDWLEATNKNESESN